MSNKNYRVCLSSEEYLYDKIEEQLRNEAVYNKDARKSFGIQWEAKINSELLKYGLVDKPTIPYRVSHKKTLHPYNKPRRR